jgi:hypothetical protein
MQLLVAGISAWDTQFSDEHILRIWESTPEGSPLTNYTMLWMVSKWQHEEVFDMIIRQKVPKQFFEQFAVVALHCMEQHCKRLSTAERMIRLQRQVFDLT